VLVGRAEMKIVVTVATMLVLTAGGALAEAATLPKASSLLGGTSEKKQMHHYVAKLTKHTSPEWGLRTASLRSLPVQIHPYVTGRTRF
jgi:hypothetical protein